MLISYSKLNFPFTIHGLLFRAYNLTYSSSTITFPEHNHGPGCYEIHYVEAGKGTLKVQNQDYPLTSQTLYVTGPHVLHSQIPDPGDPLVEYCLIIQLEPLQTKSGKDPLSTHHSPEFLSAFRNTTFWHGTDTQNLSFLLKKIFDELANKHTGYVTEVTALLNQLIIHIIRNYESKQETSCHFDTVTPETSQLLIVDECFIYEYQTLTLDRLASRLGISPRQTERLLKKQYGLTFTQKRTQARMAVAISLLKDNTLSLSDIAEKLGYSSVGHFSSAFYKTYGYHARTYRSKTNPE